MKPQSEDFRDFVALRARGVLECAGLPRRSETKADFARFQGAWQDHGQTKAIARTRRAPIVNRQSPIVNRQSPIANRQSPIANRQSPIANRQSPIANRQSPIVNCKSNMKLHRSYNDTSIAGVCGGLAEYLGWDSGRLRIVWVLATIFTAFAGVIVYLVLWFLMPKATPPPQNFEPAVLQPWKKQS